MDFVSWAHDIHDIPIYGRSFKIPVGSKPPTSIYNHLLPSVKWYIYAVYIIINQPDSKLPKQVPKQAPISQDV